MQVIDKYGAVGGNRIPDLLITNQNKSAANTRPPARLFYAKASLGPIYIKYLRYPFYRVVLAPTTSRG